MKADCHIHMILDGAYYRAAIDHQRSEPDDRLIRERLKAYADAGITFLRDGGDAWNVGKTAARIAPEYGIDYRTPIFPIHRKGRYGAFIGRGYSEMSEYRALITEAKNAGADFIKIMISGIMDFNEFGKLSCDPLDAGEIAEMIRIAHDEGLRVMAHANGAECVYAAVNGGVDSIEHGAYLNAEVLRAMAEHSVIWVPTISTIVNLIGCGRYPDDVLRPLSELHSENIRAFVENGGIVAPGSDAGAYRVPHVNGCADEYRILTEIIGDRAKDILEHGVQMTADRFRRAV